MAKRRMFSLEIVDTDMFLDMPPSSRLLYYDLGMRADDEGFVTPQKVIRTTGASADDLKVLQAKHFVHLFEDGVIIILDWLEMNIVAPSKLTLSQYHNRLKIVEKIRKSFEKRLKNHEDKVNLKYLPEPKTNAGIMHAKDRLGKGSINNNIISKDIISIKLGGEKNSNTESLEKPKEHPERWMYDSDEEYEVMKKVWGEEQDPTTGVEAIAYGNQGVNEIMTCWKEHFGIKPDGTVRDNRYAANRLIKAIGKEKTINSIKYAASVRSHEYAPSISSLRELELKMTKLVSYFQKKNNPSTIDYAAMESQGTL